MLHILHLEDNLLDAELIAANLLESNLEFEIKRVDTREDFLAALENKCFDLILADYSLPSFDGLAALEIAFKNCPNVPFIIISGALGEELAIETLKSGATDYILKHRLERLIPAAERALRESEERERIRRAETALLESEERYRLIVEGVRDYAIFKVDTQGCITSWNLGAERLLGYEEKEILGKPADIIFTPEDQQAQVSKFELQAAKEYGRSQDVRWHLRKDGSRFFADGLVNALYDVGSKNIIGFVKIMRDNTALHLAEEERKQLLLSEQAARHKAEEANRLKDEFLATVSHELRTPLNAIYGWATMLKSGRLDSDTAINAVTIIERNAKAQIQLVEDLLDVSRMITGKLRLDVVPTEPAMIIQAAIDTVRPAADAKLIKIETDFDPAVGVISADPNRLQQIIWNLLANAVKFTPNNGRITISLRPIGNSIEIRVSDTGEGIAPDFLPFIFDRFRQAEQVTTRFHGGLGLGLAIVKSLVEMHGGRVSVESQGIGRGATFTVRLPQIAVLSDENNSSLNKENEDHYQPQLFDEQPASTASSLRVLAVDDDEDSRDLLKILLEQQGFVVTTAESVRDAIERVQLAVPDIIVSDVGMPGEDGYELMRKLRALPLEKGGAVPAIALTGFARREDEERALEAGFDAHVTKPIEPENLINKIKALVKSGLSSV